MPAKKKPQSFEEQLAEVEKLISEMEDGNMPLEETLRHYESGILLLNGLEKELDNVRQRLSVLRTQPDGTLAEEPVEETP